jgi:hypothetical protein
MGKSRGMHTPRYFIQYFFTGDNMSTKVELQQQLETQREALEQRATELSEFKPMDVESINAEMSTINETNKLIRDNIRHVEVESEIAALTEKFSDGLKKMREIEQKKIKVYQESNMPVEGLQVGENDIMFPDPKTGEIVNFSSLSTGQQIQLGIRMLSPFLPDEKTGIRAIIINDINALDEKNYAIMLESAKNNNIELIMHKTVMKSESNICEIVIEER